MKTIGILGGIGPQATMDFEARLHRVSNRLIPAKGNRGYPPLVSVYVRHPPVLVDERDLPVAPLTLDPRFLEAARRLRGWVDLLVIPSNTPHLFLKELEDVAGCEILSIVDGVADELRARPERPVGLLGLGVPEVYRRRFAQEGLETLTASAETRDALDGAILRLMEGAAGDRERRVAREAVAELRRAGARVVVLGCSEIPLLLGDAVQADHSLVDPVSLLAERAVRRAISRTSSSASDE